MAQIERQITFSMAELLRSFYVECEQCGTQVRVGTLPDNPDRGLWCPRCETGQNRIPAVLIAGSAILIDSIRKLKADALTRVSVRLTLPESQSYRELGVRASLRTTAERPPRPSNREAERELEETLAEDESGGAE